ncbi:aminoglycoside phosphotransferase family protein [Kribbella albertanoniae]|uniref:aminoglycoside phosphotransferase family protein n=1 Tax=Kribbella albertanoniae TaxID=1266829 RepID=UPI001404D3A9|nr:aminoglycoside phosphotransferase family protein [Kribbella albertanoniae]
MDTPTSAQIARTFGLGTAGGDLVHIRRGDSDAWRLRTSGGSYFVKGYLEDSSEQLTLAMAFERRALAAGVDMPSPIMPVDPVLGWAIRLAGQWFRAYRWIEHDMTQAAVDIAPWLGRTMLRVHQVEPMGHVGLPEWWRSAVPQPEVWEGWLATARERDVAWAGLLGDCLPAILAVGERIAGLSEVAADVVRTHGDFKDHNIVRSAAGPVLVDWDSVRTDSAALEAGRSAYLFGGGEPLQIRRILAAYVAAGGELDWAGPDLFLGVARHHVQVLAEQIRVSLGEAAPARWMGDRTTIETAIGTRLRDLPGTLERLRYLARETSSE